ncbi:MAG: fibronectin type III domain-containing protein, partial [Bryobacteraceae bacterium]
YRLTWRQQRPGMHFDVYRQGPSDKIPVKIGTTEKPEYLDTTSHWDAHYAYTVVALLDAAESLPSQPVRVIHADTFPPAVPAGLTALATPDSIDISWQRVSSANLKGYYLYRSVNGGPFARLGGLLMLPTYTDRAVAHGKAYRYEVGSISQKGYESAESAPTEQTTFP